MYRMFAISVVFPTGLKLTAGQTARLNQWVLTRGLGCGHVFVHTITLTDVAHNGLVIDSNFCCLFYQSFPLIFFFCLLKIFMT